MSMKNLKSKSVSGDSRKSECTLESKIITSMGDQGGTFHPLPMPTVLR